jgi:hypothetical protein
MSERILNMAMIAVPAAVRKSSGAEISGMAADMIEGGESNVVREASGIVGYGLKKRVLNNRDWLRDLPWGDSLRLLALPIASLQMTMLLLSGVYLNQISTSNPWPGKWAVVAFLIGALTVYGAARRRPWVLSGAATALLVLLAYDEYGPGGGMVQGTSHTLDFSFPLVHQSILSPVALILIPTTVLLIACGVAMRGAWAPQKKSEKVVRAAWCALPAAALLLIPHQHTTNNPAFTYGACATLIFFAAVIALGVTAMTERRPERGLAAGLLLGTQWILLGVQTLVYVPYLSWIESLSISAAIAVVFAICCVPLVIAGVMIRLTAGPRRLP